MAEQASNGGDERAPDRVIDLDRAAMPGPPPVPGAQWDELNVRWERWDDESQAWVVVDADGEEVAPAVDELLPSHLARELLRADELDERDERVTDVRRKAPEPAHVPGAQWNEIDGRWERWDDDAGAWVDALVGSDSLTG